MADSRPIEEIPLKELIACPDCDLLMLRERLQSTQEACCPRCASKLYLYRPRMLSRSLALVLTALLLYIPANFEPIMHMDIMGLTSRDTVWSGVLSLYHADMPLVATLVFLFSMLVPLLKLLCQLFVLLSIRWNLGRRLGIHCFLAYHKLKEWGMLEVYLMGILVSIVKLLDMATLHIGLGFACFVGLLLSQIWLEVTMSPQQVWDALESTKVDDAGN